MNDRPRKKANHDLPTQDKAQKSAQETVQEQEDAPTQQDEIRAEQGAPADNTDDGGTDESQAPEAQPDAESLEQTLEQTLEEVEKFRDLALRAEAEMQNMRRRTQRDIENAHKYGLERFLQNLLPVADSLEKGIGASVDDTQTEAEHPMVEGIRLCHKLLMDILAKENVVVIDPVGEPFDPNEHQAISMVEHQDMEPNSVVTVVQKGYKLNNRLMRAATVMVSKTPEAEAPQTSLTASEAEQK